MKVTASLRVRVLSELPALRAMTPEWTDLWMRCRHATPFQRPEWLLSWIEAFSPTRLCVLEVRRDQKLIGLAPMFSYRCGRERILAPVGAGISDYLDWLIDPGGERDIVSAILAQLETENDGCRIDLPDLRETSPLLRCFSPQVGLQKNLHDSCPVLRLPSSIEELPKVVPPDQLRHLRAARRRIGRAGKCGIEVATRETLDEFLVALLQLHGRRWRESGELGVLADQRVQAFHRLAARALLERGVLRLYGLRFEGKLIASLYALAERDVIYCYLQGFDPAYAEFSPGMQILGAVIEDAARHGKRRVDLLRGREKYKYSWGARDEPTYRITLTRQSLSSTDPRLSRAV
jgi:CelD/BcsL family acetyltransferase involved in cellulose biosynthesis